MKPIKSPSNIALSIIPQQRCLKVCFAQTLITKRRAVRQPKWWIGFMIGSNISQDLKTFDGVKWWITFLSLTVSLSLSLHKHSKASVWPSFPLGPITIDSPRDADYSGNLALSHQGSLFNLESFIFSIFMLLCALKGTCKCTQTYAFAHHTLTWKSQMNMSRALSKAKH